VIRKRSEHGLGHLLNPLDPDCDDRDWITDIYPLLIDHPETLLTACPAWLDLPALTRIALTTNEVARAFAAYNTDRPWPEQVKPFNFLLHAHIDPLGYPVGVDPTHFRLVAPYESDPNKWLQLPWVDLHTGTLHPVTTNPNDHRSTLAHLKTYRDVLTLYALHPEPKSLDPNGQPCSRRSPPGLLARRPVTLLTLSLIGKESNRLEETIAGLIGSLDETLATYNSPNENTWTTLVLPALAGFPTRQLAALTELDARSIQRIKTRATNTPHDRNRALLTLITAQLASQQLETWGITPPRAPLEQIATYLDNRDTHKPVRRCVVCGTPLSGRQRSYCSEAHKKAAYRARRSTVRSDI
jgi:hypothetical protein